MNIGNLHNERDLLQLVAAGDQGAFTTLFDHYKDGLYTLAWGLTRSDSIAEDILQEVFLKIWLHRAELGIVENFRGYLVVVTRRVILNELRKTDRSKRREQLYASNNESPGLDAIIDQLQEKQYSQLLQQALQTLPPQQASVFDLIKTQGYSREAAAGILQLSPETVKKHLERAMRTIRAFLLAHLDSTLLLLLYIMYV